MERRFRLAVGQSPAELFSTETRLQWLGATLPEDQISFFCQNFLLPATILAMRSKKRAQPADVPIAKEIARLAKAHAVAIHYGFPEAAEGRIFDSAQCLGPDGKRLNKSRKLLIPPGFERDYFTLGQGCALFGVRIHNQ